MFDLSSKMV